MKDNINNFTKQMNKILCSNINDKRKEILLEILFDEYNSKEEQKNTKIKKKIK